MPDKDNRAVYIRRSIYVLIILAACLLQTTRRGFPSVFGIKALPVLPMVVSVAMFERGFAGMFFGLFTGLVCDIFSACHDGFYIIMFTAIGFICGTLITYYMRNNIVTALFLTVLSCLCVNTLYWLFFIVLNHTDLPFFLLVRFYLPSALYTAVWTPVFYYIVMKLSDKIKKPRRTFTF